MRIILGIICTGCLTLFVWACDATQSICDVYVQIGYNIYNLNENDNVYEITGSRLSRNPSQGSIAYNSLTKDIIVASGPVEMINVNDGYQSDIMRLNGTATAVTCCHNGILTFICSGGDKGITIYELKSSATEKYKVTGSHTIQAEASVVNISCSMVGQNLTFKCCMEEPNM